MALVAIHKSSRRYVQKGERLGPEGQWLFVAVDPGHKIESDNSGLVADIPTEIIVEYGPDPDPAFRRVFRIRPEALGVEVVETSEVKERLCVAKYERNH